MFKFKTLAAAAALVLAAPAFAALKTDITGNAELFLGVQDSAAGVSYVMDLGLLMDDFIVNGQAEAGYSLSFNVAADPAWTQFLGMTSASKRTWSVLGIENTGGSAGTRALTTSDKPAATMDNTLTAAIQQSGWGNTQIGSFYTEINKTGTHATQENGSSVNTSQDSGNAKKAYFGGTQLKPKANNNFTYSSANAIGVDSFFYTVTGQNTVTKPLIVGQLGNTMYQGVWSFDGQTLTYTLAAAVPEPATYALMVAGLLAVGALARRRQR